MNYDATLAVQNQYDCVIGSRVWGFIRGDKKERFADGDFVHISRIVNIVTDTLNKQTYLVTQNSVYLLVDEE